ncbi:radical SAM protein [Candidatus Woesearchaeota archaeon]|nr:radical SAM protein [Candidatus Woesearchaeota archaeon]
MALLKFNDLRFIDEKDRVKVVFLRIYGFHLSRQELESIGAFKVHEDAIEFDCPDKKASNKFSLLLAKGFEGLVCSLNNLKAVYIHRNSGIPLIGEGVFGLIDRNTNCIEVKPLTACNLDCVFCSVDAGSSSRKMAEFIVEKDYLVEEFNKLAARKEHPVEAHIGPQGEPLLYAPLVELVRDLRQNPKVKVVSIDTNGTLLTEKLVDKLANAGLTRLNISLQSLDEKKCSYLAGKPYNLKHVLEMIRYASEKMSVLLAPVIVPGMNDEHLEGIIGLAKELGIESQFPVLGIQNYLNYKRGRNPVKQRSWDDFFEMLGPHEKKSGLKLRLAKEDFGIRPDTKLEKPFEKKQVVKARIACEGPLKGEKIAVARIGKEGREERAIIVEKAERARMGSEAKVLLIRDKHNIFRGVLK